MKFVEFLNEAPEFFDRYIKPTKSSDKSMKYIFSTLGNDPKDSYKDYDIYYNDDIYALAKNNEPLIIVALAEINDDSKFKAISNIIKSSTAGPGIALTIYDYLIEKYKYVISDERQTGGGIKIWKKLYDKYKDNFGYFDGQKFIKIDSEHEISKLYGTKTRLMIKK